jgi:predicted dehydrogenase
MVNMAKIKVGIVGMGYISVSHIEAIRRLGFAEVNAVADVNYELAKKKAEGYYIPKCYASVEEMIADSEICVIHNCTPNYLHKEINEKIIRSGKHLFSEKPLAKNSKESGELLKVLGENPKVVAGVNFNYRMNPLVQEMKERVQKGEIGEPKLVHGSYLQDWLLYETDYNWRIEPEVSGLSRCVADIGSHWMDSVQVVTGAKIIEVCSDLVTTIPVRKKPKGQVEAFAVNINTEYEEKEITTEDYGAVLFKMDNGTHGVFYVSQVSAGRKCYLNFEVNGEKASLYWNQENADRMWMGFRDEHNCDIIRNPNLMPQNAREYTYLAAGHPEGWNDAMTNNVKSFYRFILDGKTLGIDKCDFATFEEGHYIMKITESILQSSRERKWVRVE